MGTTVIVNPDASRLARYGARLRDGTVHPGMWLRTAAASLTAVVTAGVAFGVPESGLWATGVFSTVGVGIAQYAYLWHKGSKRDVSLDQSRNGVGIVSGSDVDYGAGRVIARPCLPLVDIKNPAVRKELSCGQLSWLLACASAELGVQIRDALTAVGAGIDLEATLMRVDRLIWIQAVRHYKNMDLYEACENTGGVGAAANLLRERYTRAREALVAESGDCFKVLWRLSEAALEAAATAKLAAEFGVEIHMLEGPTQKELADAVMLTQTTDELVALEAAWRDLIEGEERLALLETS